MRTKGALPLVNFQKSCSQWWDQSLIIGLGDRMGDEETETVGIVCYFKDLDNDGSEDHNSYGGVTGQGKSFKMTQHSKKMTVAKVG